MFLPLHFAECKLRLSRRSSCDVNPCTFPCSLALWHITAIAADDLDDGAVDDYGDRVMTLAIMMVMRMIMIIIEMVMPRKPMLMALGLF